MTALADDSYLGKLNIMSGYNCIAFRRCGAANTKHTTLLAVSCMNELLHLCIAKGFTLMKCFTCALQKASP
jgi:hypothetical protein